MTQPTVLFHGEDAGDSYYFWQWITPIVGEPKIHVIERDSLSPLLDRLTESLPGPVEVAADSTTENVTAAQAAMMKRVLTEGVFATYANELAFSTELGSRVLPVELAAEIVEQSRLHGRVLLRVLPAPSCARVPWELLPVVVDGVVHRLVEYADVATDPPVGIYAGRAKHPADWTEDYAAAAAVYVVDPETRVEGTIFTSGQRRAFNLARGNRDAPAPGGRITRADLSKSLRAQPSPSRLFYLGHVASSDEQPGATSMLLSDPPSMFGVVRSIRRGNGANRPFSAFDAVEGTLYAEERLAALGEPPESIVSDTVDWPTGSRSELAGAEIWPMPARVALIACNSGGDLAHPEPFGLVIACLNAGAGLVTATRWTLPTDFAFRDEEELTSNDPQPLLEMALRIDLMHASENPVRAISEFQLEQLAAWELTETAPNVARSPIMWAALTTYLAPHKEPVALSAEELAFLSGAEDSA